MSADFRVYQAASIMLDSTILKLQATLRGIQAPKPHVRQQPQRASLRERRRSVSASQLSVSLDATASRQPGPVLLERSVGTAFFSPSCHDWNDEKLLQAGGAWTPFESPRRSNGSASSQLGRWPSVQAAALGRGSEREQGDAL